MTPRSQEAYGGIRRSGLNLDIPSQSATNVANLWTALRPLSSDENDFYMAFIRLPFILEHRSGNWKIIKGTTKESPGIRNWDAQLLSLFEIAKLMAARPRKYTRVKHANKANWLYPGTELNPAEPQIDQDFTFVRIAHKNIPQVMLSDIPSFHVIAAMLGDLATRINTSMTDFNRFGNIDFVFFKWWFAGHVSVEQGQGGGVAGGKPKHFVDHRLYVDGFITFDDWVSYYSTQIHNKDLATVWNGFDQPNISVGYNGGTRVKTYAYRGVSHTKTIPEELFFAQDIFQGAALTVIQHLRWIDPENGFIRYALQNGFLPHVAKFMSTVWQLLEAKLPGSLDYYHYKIAKVQALGQVPFTDTAKY